MIIKKRFRQLNLNRYEFFKLKKNLIVFIFFRFFSPKDKIDIYYIHKMAKQMEQLEKFTSNETSLISMFLSCKSDK